MAVQTEITERFSLEKFKKLVQLIIECRSQTKKIVPNNKNGYFRAADHDGHLHVCRSLLNQAPERAMQVEDALIKTIYSMVSSESSIFFSKRNLLSHEQNKSENLTKVFALKFQERYFACGGLQSHENIALVVLFICFSSEDYYSPQPVPREYINEYVKVYSLILEKSEERSSDGQDCVDALNLIDLILSQKKTVWPIRNGLPNPSN